MKNPVTESAKPVQIAKTPASSPFRTASDLLKEDQSHSENGRRIERWAEAMVRGRKLAPGWKEDRDAAATVRWIGDRSAGRPETAKPKKIKSRAEDY